jgi:uncharacterized repeat protein (TIGR03803 family)
MIPVRIRSSKALATGALALVVLSTSLATHPCAAQLLYSFTDQNGDGDNPYAGVIIDKKGDLYGTTMRGGDSGDGTVFELLANGTETILHSFAGGSDGIYPEAVLLRANSGTLYGTTAGGGANGDGVVFAIARDGAETILHSFAGGADGAIPLAGLIKDRAGNLYGTTSTGGGSGCGGAGCGTVFKVGLSGAYSILHAFAGNDGANPRGGVIHDGRWNLYGTTAAGGAMGAGAVFELAPDGSERVVYSFTGGSDGGEPAAGLIRDTSGNLYGTTEFGGNSTNFCYPTRRVPSLSGCGTVFKIDRNGLETVLYNFCPQANCWDGSVPEAGLIMDSAGDLYGTTTVGGLAGAGTIFEVMPGGAETVIHYFSYYTPPRDGEFPAAGLATDGTGGLYGTTQQGGVASSCFGMGGCGAVFKL